MILVILIIICGETGNACCVYVLMFSVYRLPVLSTVPRSGTWFLRYVISFMSHLARGGRIDDRLTGDIVGRTDGQPFDFGFIRGGPLFRVTGTLPADHLFVGHAVCPGFDDIAKTIDWWSRTAFHVRGYDCFHEEESYRHTPVDLAPYEYAPVDVAAMERAAQRGRGAPIVLVFRNPIDQAASYFRYCQVHADPAYRLFRGKPLAETNFRDYLLDAALISYARQFISYQLQAARHPHLVKLIAYEHLVERPLETMTGLLNHLAGSERDWPMLAAAIHLARKKHMRAVEAHLGRSLDGTRLGSGSHITTADDFGQEWPKADALRDEAIARLDAMGIDCRLIEWPASQTSRYGQAAE